IPWALGDAAYAYVETVDFLNFDSQPAKEIDPKLLLELPQLKVVWLNGRQVNDDWLACIAEVSHLEAAILSGNEEITATSTGLKPLQEPQHLGSLVLSGSWVRNETIASVPTLSALQSLALNDVPHVTSAAL